MQKTKKFPLLNIWIIVSCLSLLGSYFLLQPRFSNIIPFVRHSRLNTFIQNTIRNNFISPQEFWQLREFYSPGNIQFNKPNLTFSSSKIVSRETLIDTIIPLQSLLPKKESWHVLYKNTNELIATKENMTFIYFVKPPSEMIKANAYFDDVDTDEKLLKSKNWYVVTQIQQ